MSEASCGLFWMFFASLWGFVVLIRVRAVTPSILTAKIVRVGDIVRDLSLGSYRKGPNSLGLGRLAVQPVLRIAPGI